MALAKFLNSFEKWVGYGDRCFHCLKYNRSYTDGSYRRYSCSVNEAERGVFPPKTYVIQRVGGIGSRVLSDLRSLFDKSKSTFCSLLQPVRHLERISEGALAGGAHAVITFSPAGMLRQGRLVSKRRIHFFHSPSAKSYRKFPFPTSANIVGGTSYERSNLSGFWRKPWLLPQVQHVELLCEFVQVIRIQAEKCRCGLGIAVGEGVGAADRSAFRLLELGVVIE